MNKQLFEKQANSYKPIYPLVRLEDIIETISDKSIQWILNNYNHIYVEYSESVAITRNKVPQLLRRTGIWISYNAGTEVITEYYKGDNKDVTNFIKWTDDDNWERFDKIKHLDGSITYQHLSESLRQLIGQGNNITNFPDDEDLEVKDGLLKFKDRDFEPNNFSGLGRVILRKNIKTVDGQPKNVLTQDMINKENTIYEIRYDFDLNGEEITIPEGCVLDFQGGNIKNGLLKLVNDNISLIGNGNTLIERNLNSGYSESIRIEGNNIIIKGIKFKSNVTYEHSTINDNNLHICIQSYYSNNILIKDCSFEKTNACVAFDTCNNIEINNCYFREAYENIHSYNYGYGVVLNQVNNANIHNCNFIDVERHSIYISCHADINAKNSTNIYFTDNYVKALESSFKTAIEVPCKTICGDNINFINNTIIGGPMPFLIAVSAIDGGTINIINNTTIGDKHRAFVEMYPQLSTDYNKSVKSVNVIGNRAYLNSDEYPVFCHLANVSGLCSIKDNIAISPRGGYAFRIKTESEYTQSVAKTSIIKSENNILKGFNGGYYINNVANFIATDNISPFTTLIEGKKYWRPCEAIENVGECKITIQPLTNIDYMDVKNYPYILAFGVSYYDRELQDTITCIDTANNIWINSKGNIVVGKTSDRPNINYLSEGFRYYDTDAKIVIIFDGYDWQELNSYSKIPNVVYEENMPSVTGYSNRPIYNEKMKQPLWYDAYFHIWKNANGLPYNKTFGVSENRPLDVPIGSCYYDTTLNKPIWYKGNNVWVDATGADV